MRPAVKPISEINLSCAQLMFVVSAEKIKIKQPVRSLARSSHLISVVAIEQKKSAI